MLWALNRSRTENMNNYLVLSKQDRLDNLVWLLFRSRELNVSILSDLESSLIGEAQRLQRDIYSSCIEQDYRCGGLQDYYESWKLRGDHPSLYQYGSFNKMGKSVNVNDLKVGYFSAENQYELSKKNENHDVVLTEQNCRLYYSYQFEREVREEGQKMTDVKITPEYIDLIRRMQDGMIRELAGKGIFVECNPSSNVSIGTFRRYDEHPIFRFNRFGLDDTFKNSDQLYVSVNTDDQGIFDTSLENEYALIARCLEKQRNEDGSQKYSSQAILRYLYNLREMGEMQVFPKAFQSKKESWKNMEFDHARKEEDEG